MKNHSLLASLIIVPFCAIVSCAPNQGVNPPDSQQETEEEYEPFDIENLPEMVDIPEGLCQIGTANPSAENYDEAPAHTIVVSAFRMGKYEITNRQFEEFRPEHKTLRGNGQNPPDAMGGFSKGDDDAVVNVSWEDAVAYCKWLSRGTGEHYRLPTEAEWEYACRAGTTSDYYTGNSLPSAMQKQQSNNRDLKYVSLEVGKGTPNAFGLYDMHGNVEEWCMDWYGTYPSARQINTAGPREGVFKVTRGGSHNTPVTYLRSANRSAATPDDAHVMIGFRVVCSDEDLSYYDAPRTTPRYAQDVNQGVHSWGSAGTAPFWLEPIPFVVEPGDGTPFYTHNHQPSITWCDNGDLFAIWYTCNAEAGREMEVVASRFRKGASQWDKASSFFKVPDRNMTGSAIFRIEDGTLVHMNGVGNAGEWQNLALCMRRSDDNGKTWSAPELVEPRHEKRHQVIGGTLTLENGDLIQLCDAEAGGSGGTSVHLSQDEGYSWEDLWNGSASTFRAGGSGSSIAGIHAAVVELRNGSLMAFGRGDNISNKMPCSKSSDGGRTWTYSASPFPGIGSGQRHVMIRLNEGPIMLASFGSQGLFVSISEDEGATWSAQKLMTDGKTRTLNGGAHTGTFTMTANQAEPKGYFACTQTPDGTIHLISSRLHYRFNLAWIKQ